MYSIFLKIMKIIPNEIVSELNVISLKIDKGYDTISAILFGNDHERKPDEDSHEYSEFVQLLEYSGIELYTYESRCNFSKKLSLVMKRGDFVVLGYVIQVEIIGNNNRFPEFFTTWFSSSLDDSLDAYYNTQSLPFLFDSVLNALRVKHTRLKSGLFD